MSPEVTFKHPEMGDAGDPCESCRMFWKIQGMPPRTLVFLKNGEETITTDYGIPIVVCPHCDGTRIIEFNRG